ncbi:AAA family ATPase [Nonomuraea sp. NN258]|uniref:AfsR/SARP family transcriptional regulator n=1 Tax=Nonomuraea antri TaxID=2730852 RepID=UPI00156812F3|nr:AfsR/SARP family transcriptional regulator [Nonomuraea antri]NRQ35887.1 AAA family ATPase [Nonomuraea antri]
MEVHDADGDPVYLGGPRPRAVLARLLAAQGSAVSTGTLIDDVYGYAAPPSALSSMHSYVCKLRRAIEPDRGRRARPRLLIARPPGYLLAADDVDAVRFAELVRRAEVRASEEALAVLDQALRLWRGAAYEEFLNEPWAFAESTRLDELRLTAVERRAEVLLDLGRPQPLIAELEAETAANPLRERLWRLLALALYRTGRQAESLAVLRKAAKLLSDELGLDPWPELRSLEKDILRQADWLAPAGTGTPLTVTPPPPSPPDPLDGLDGLHGRDAQLAELAALPARATRVGFAAATVSGEPGIGKTRLLEAFGEHCARGLGHLVLWGRCLDGAGTPALSPWTQVFDVLDQHCPPPDRPAGLFDVPAGPGDSADALVLRRNRALADRLVSASRVRPLVIVLDDLQWADTASLDLLRYLVTSLRGGAVTLVTAFRTGTEDVLGRLVRYDLLRLPLSGIGPEAVRAIGADLGVQLDTASCARMAERTGGNPFFLRESIAMLNADPAVDLAVDELPAAVSEVVRLRLDALAEARRPLEVAALIGNEFDPSVVARVAGEKSYDLLDQAVRAGLLIANKGTSQTGGQDGHSRGRWASLEDGNPLAYGGSLGGGGSLAGSGAGAVTLAFVHDLVREALVRELPPLRRATVHRDLAAVLAERPATDVAVIAHHAVQAGPAACAEAVRWAGAAAGQAELRLAYAESAAWLGRAIIAHNARGGSAAELVELLLRQVRALLAAGEPVGARHARQAAIQVADRLDDGEELVVRALTALDAPSLWTLRDPYGEIDRLVVHRFETALRERPESDDPERAMLLAGLAQELGDHSGAPPTGPPSDPHLAPHPDPNTSGSAARAGELSARAVAMARRLGDPALLRRALNARHLALPQPPHVPELTAIAAELHELSADAPGFELLASMMDTHNRLEMFDVAGADRAAARCDLLLERLALPWPRFQHTLWRAGRLVLDGRFDEAATWYADAAGQAEHLGIWHAAAAVTTGRVLMHHHQGTMAEAGPLVDAIGGVHPTLDRATRILQLVAQGRVVEARGLDDRLTAQPPLDWSWLSTTCLRAAAAASLGRVPECRALYEALLPFHGRITVVSACIWAGPVDWYLALLAEAMGNRDAAARHLSALEGLAETGGLTWWRRRAAESRLRLADAWDLLIRR